MRAWVAVLLLVLGLVAPRSGRGEPRLLVATLTLEKGPGAERCVEAPELERAVEARLGRRVFGVRTPADLDVRLALERPRAGEWRGELRLLDDAGNELGQREIVTKAKDCSALDASLALVVALLVDAPPNLPPERTNAPVPSAPSAEPAPPPPPPPPRKNTAIQLPRDTYAPREPWRFNAAIAASGAAGIAPRPLLGVAAAFGFRPPRGPEFRLAGEFFPAVSLEFQPERGAELTLLRVGLDVCPLEHEAGGVRLSGCAGQKVGWAHVSGFGFDRNVESDELYYAIDAAGSAWWFLTSALALELSVTLEVPLVRNAYVTGTDSTGREELYRASPVAGSAQIGAGIEF